MLLGNLSDYLDFKSLSKDLFNELYENFRFSSKENLRFDICRYPVPK